MVGQEATRFWSKDDASSTKMSAAHAPFHAQKSQALCLHSTMQKVHAGLHFLLYFTGLSHTFFPCTLSCPKGSGPLPAQHHAKSTCRFSIINILYRVGSYVFSYHTKRVFHILYGIFKTGPYYTFLGPFRILPFMPLLQPPSPSLAQHNFDAAHIN